MKKALSLVLALLMLMSLCITPVMAAEPEGSESNPYYVANPMAAPGFITIPANSAVYYQYKAAVFNGWEVGGYGLTSIIVDGVVYDTPDMWGEIYAPLNFNMMSPGIVAYVNDTAEDVQVMISHNEPLGTENNPDTMEDGENAFSIPANNPSYVVDYVPNANGEYTFFTEQSEDFIISIDIDGTAYTLDGSLTLELESYIPVRFYISPIGITGDITLTVTPPKAGTEANPHWLEVDTLYEINGTEPTYFQVDGFLSGNELLVESFNGTDLTITLDGVDYIAEGGALYLPLETENWVMDLVISQASSAKNTVYFSIQYAEGTEQNPFEIVLGDNEISIPEGVEGYYYAYTVEKDGLLVATPAAVDGISYLSMANADYSSYAYLAEGASSMMMPVTAGEVITFECYPLTDEETWVALGVETVLNLALKDLVLYTNFESGELQGWGSSSNLSVDDEHAISGWYAAKFEVTADWGNMFNYINLEPNTDYVITFKAMAAQNKNLWVKFNAGWAYDIAEATVSLTNEWQDYEVTLNSGDHDSAVLLLQHPGYAADGQTVWVDDFLILKAEKSEPPVADDDNLFVNGDFETGDNTGWEIWQSTEISADAAHSGSYGAHLQGNGSWGGMLNQTVTVIPGKTYKLSFWLNVVATGCNVQVKDGSGVDIEGAGGWFDAKNVDKLVEWTFVATDDKVLINFCGGGNGNAESVYVDDFSLVEVNPPSNDGYITNGDFETGDLSSWTNLWGSCTVSFVEGYESTTAISVSGGSWTQVRQNGIAIEPDTDYILTAWVKNADNFALAVKTGDDSADIKTAGPLNNTEWTKVELKFNTGVDKSGNELEINSICVLLMSWDGGGSAIVDNVTLVKDEGGDEPGDDPIAPPVAPEVPENAIVNDNFDNGETQGWSSSSTIAVVDGVLEFQCTQNWANIYKYVNAMKPNTDYVYRFNARANMKQTMNIKVNNNWAGDTGKGIVDVTTEWQTYEVVVNSGDLTSTALVLFSSNVEASAGLVLYLDNISIAEVKDELPEGYVCYEDFENGTGTWGTNADATIETVPYADVPVANANGGDYALKHTIPSGKYPFISDRTPYAVEPNTDYTISIDVLNTKSNWPIQILVGTDYWFGGSVYNSDAVVPGTSAWGTYTFHFNSGDNTELYFGMKSQWADTVVYFDNFTVSVKTDDPVNPDDFDSGLIENGGFETGNESGWQIWQSTEITADAAHSGSYGAHLQGNGSWGGMLNQTVTVIPGKTYKLSFWLNVVATGCNVQVKDGSGVDIEGAGGWFDAKNVDKLVEWTFVATDDSVFINFCGGGNGNAESVYVDDFSLVQLKDPSFDGYITNGDFETGELTGWINLYDGCGVEFVEGYESDTAISITAGNWSQVRQNNIAVEPNTDYVLSAWVKNANNFGLIVKTGDDSGDIDNAYIEECGDWSQYTVKFNSGEQTSICVLLIGWEGGGSAIVDNVTLEKVEAPAYLPGDANGDGRVNNKDLGLIQQYLADFDVTISNMNAFDVNGDGRVNNKDLGLIQQYLADFDVELKYGAIAE